MATQNSDPCHDPEYWKRLYYQSQQAHQATIKELDGARRVLKSKDVIIETLTERVSALV